MSGWEVNPSRSGSDATGNATVVLVNSDPNATCAANYQSADALARSIVPGARVYVTGYSVGFNRAMRVYRGVRP